jgi:hypothetical protein
LRGDFQEAASVAVVAAVRASSSFFRR